MTSSVLSANPLSPQLKGYGEAEFQQNAVLSEEAKGSNFAT